MIWTDSHCHLAMTEESEALLKAAREAGVRGFVVPGTKADDSEECVRLAERHDGVWAAVGFHPHEASDCSDEAFERISELGGRDEVVAIGEAGLDYYYDHSPRDQQKKVLGRHIELARELGKPVIIHNRESTEDLLDILRSYGARENAGILHSFTESWEVARELIEIGYLISFSGIVTFRSAESLRDAAKQVPLESMLVETDTPYLAPVPHRGKSNQPMFVRHTGELIAELKGLDAAEVAEATTRNFERIFAVEVR